MGEISGARAELDRLGAVLRAQLVELIADLTPDADLGLLFLDEPTVADWSEPPRYHYSGLIRGERPATVAAADIARRATALLAGAGWEVGEVADTSGPKPAVVVTGRRDGLGIEVRVGDHTSAVMFSGRTPALALREPEEFRLPDPVRTPETLTSGHVLCYECRGLGACPECGGRGWLGEERCPECHGSRVCPICGGDGELAISELSPYQRTHYPELR
ncbi:hypothetical protein [Nocardia seriolae]|uniref:Uncharacterized protein n=1 Tax=Nocardia seriolae TaxID=37332 RepID=A0A0B8NE12_9NOCA|nr:hypothetical protein [Nocardia seriolae]APB01556.1 hypothetical protein NS506_07536 [Nocardia seriolae]MTJ60966.1 hypothetical protein [Nocardia seriolae]MTJ71523.1 hypothetical protein [Nocardia seriolae]MTJ90900.1 hypothetical protein [Nocardia seriolae]MTK34857.1 hypothetical protein [Nocardia seriolae]